MGSPPAEPGLNWDELYGRYSEELARFMVKLLGDRERAADIVHDTFVRAMRSEGDLRDPGSVRPWLYKIAANLAHNELQRHSLIAFCHSSATSKVHRTHSMLRPPDHMRCAHKRDQAVALFSIIKRLQPCRGVPLTESRRRGEHVCARPRANFMRHAAT